MSFDELANRRQASDPHYKIQTVDVKKDYFFDFGSLGDVFIVMIVSRVGSGVMVNWHSTEGEGLKYDSNMLAEIVMAHQQLTGFPEQGTVSIHGIDVVIANRNRTSVFLVSNLLHRSRSLRTWTLPLVSQLADTFEMKYPEAIRLHESQQEAKITDNERLASDGILADVSRALSSLELQTADQFVDFSDVIKQTVSDNNISIPGIIKQLSEGTNSLLSLAYVKNPFKLISHRWNPTVYTDASQEFGSLLARYHPQKGLIARHVVSTWDLLAPVFDSPASLQFTERNSGKQFIVTGVNKYLRLGDLCVTVSVLVFLSPLIPRTTQGGLATFGPAFKISLPLSYEEQDNTKSAATTILKRLSLSNEQTPPDVIDTVVNAEDTSVVQSHNPLIAPPREQVLEDTILSV